MVAQGGLSVAELAMHYSHVKGATAKKTTRWVIVTDGIKLPLSEWRDIKRNVTLVKVSAA